MLFVKLLIITSTGVNCSKQQQQNRKGYPNILIQLILFPLHLVTLFTQYLFQLSIEPVSF